MSAERKFRTALDETRLLMLGAQILYGFEFESVFQPGLESSPGTLRLLDAVALMLMTLTVGLLIAPSARHRITLDGAISNAMFVTIRLCAGLALIPFSVSLALDIYIVLARAFGAFAALASAIVLWVMAILFWFVLEMFCRNARKEAAVKHGIRPTSLNSKIDQMLTEARITLLGAQALLGFQLIAMLTPAFDRLPFESKLLHACAFGCVAISVILLVSPAAFHRIGFNGEDTEDFYRIGSGLVTAAMLPLALGLSGDIYVAIARLSEDRMAGFVASLAALTLLLGLWYAHPLILRSRVRHPARHDEAAERLRPAARQRGLRSEP